MAAAFLRTRTALLDRVRGLLRSWHAVRRDVRAPRRNIPPKGRDGR